MSLLTMKFFVSFSLRIREALNKKCDMHIFKIFYIMEFE